MQKLIIPLSKRLVNSENIKLISCMLINFLFLRWREATALASGRQWMTAVGQRMGKSGYISVRKAEDIPIIVISMFRNRDCNSGDYLQPLSEVNSVVSY